ncbi:hypothetical protein DINM_021557 [Dirofilaria immitis]|nr:hypothetical protein [Dirofilaria immitis]
MTESATTLPYTDNIISSVSNAIITYTAKEQITAYGSIYGMALFCIVIGSIRSMYFVQKHMRKKRLIETSITMNEAKKFPLTASCVLFGLYIFSGICDAECRHRIYSVVSSYLPSKLSSRLEVFPLLTNAANASPAMKGNTSKTLLQKTSHFLPLINQRGKIEMEEGDIERASNDDFEYVLKVEWDTHDVVAILCCLCVGLSHLYRRHWITNNILGVAFSIYGIESIHLCSFKAGTMLLAGLFIYDVFWVFATDVMTTVAKGIDAPLLLQFPQDIYRHGLNNAGKHAMLGLGDIVIPGIFIALLRRFDHYIGSGGSYKKPRHYFLITIVAYCFGLLVTMSVMHFFKAAQPALLYLVPACVLVPLSIAGIRGEAHEMLNYCEEHLIEKNQSKNNNIKHIIAKSVCFALFYGLVNPICEIGFKKEVCLSGRDSRDLRVSKYPFWLHPIHLDNSESELKYVIISWIDVDHWNITVDVTIVSDGLCEGCLSSRLPPFHTWDQGSSPTSAAAENTFPAVYMQSATVITCKGLSGIALSFMRATLVSLRERGEKLQEDRLSDHQDDNKTLEGDTCFCLIHFPSRPTKSTIADPVPILAHEITSHPYLTTISVGSKDQDCILSQPNPLHHHPSECTLEIPKFSEPGFTISTIEPNAFPVSVQTL